MLGGGEVVAVAEAEAVVMVGGGGGGGGAAGQVGEAGRYQKGDSEKEMHQKEDDRKYQPDRHWASPFLRKLLQLLRDLFLTLVEVVKERQQPHGARPEKWEAHWPKVDQVGQPLEILVEGKHGGHAATRSSVVDVFSAQL